LLTNSQLVELFESSKANISEHIENIFESGELDKDSTVRDFRTVQKEGKGNVERERERERVHYRLDVIIAVGYRVNSKTGTQFRQWITQRLKHFLVQGYAINVERHSWKQQEIQTLKNGIRILSRAIEQKVQDQNLDWLNPGCSY